MTRRPPAGSRCALPSLLCAAALSLVGCEDTPPAPVVEVTFENSTATAGLQRYSETYSVVAADIDGDLRDDLLVGNHGAPPSLFLNRGGVFEEDTAALPLRRRDDRHGYTVVDLDNDGDRDLIYAGGGADGIGKGSFNRVYRSMLAQEGALRFEEVTEGVDVGSREMRARHFFPLANGAGDRVDLYLTSLHKRREGSANLYFTNSSEPGRIRLQPDRSSSLELPLESLGMDLFFDYDRDGDMDFLYLRHFDLRLYRNHDGEFEHIDTALDNMSRVFSAAVADFNNDGFPDLYLGGISGHTYSDNISGNENEIHFSIVNHNDDDDLDRMVFTARDRVLFINFVEHLSDLGKNRTDASDIFIGRTKQNPKSRKTRIGRRMARGRPESMDKHGTYIWYQKDSRQWHVVWKHESRVSAHTKGLIAARGMKLEEQADLETYPLRNVRDYIVINNIGLSWQILDLPVLKHNMWINDVTAADFNNDGLVDVVGVSSRDDAAYNGTPFIVMNHGNLQFSRKEVMDNSEDDIFRADRVVHGFFDGDGLPDVFYSNGHGLLPSHQGPYQFWLNRTATENGYLLLELEGVNANRDAVGAQIEVRDAEGGLIGYREIGPGYGRSQDTHLVHVGLGEREGPFTLRIRWPGATDLQIEALSRPGSYRLRQGEPPQPFTASTGQRGGTARTQAAP